jgi:hypothetical protein
LQQRVTGGAGEQEGAARTLVAKRKHAPEMVVPSSPMKATSGDSSSSPSSATPQLPAPPCAADARSEASTRAASVSAAGGVCGGGASAALAVQRSGASRARRHCTAVAERQAFAAAGRGAAARTALRPQRLGGEPLPEQRGAHAADSARIPSTSWRSAAAKQLLLGAAC